MVDFFFPSFPRRWMTYRGAGIGGRLWTGFQPVPTRRLEPLRARPHYFLSIRRPIAPLTTNLCPGERVRVRRSRRRNRSSVDYHADLPISSHLSPEAATVSPNRDPLSLWRFCPIGENLLLQFSPFRANCHRLSRIIEILQIKLQV